MVTIAPTPSVEQRSRGRFCFWAGIGACLIGMALAVVQFSLKHLAVPWYSPILATVGAFLLLVAVARRRTLARLMALVLIAGFAGLQWYFLVAVLKLPSYEGPARAGQHLPPFRSTLADGRSFTDEDLRDGSRRVLVFFRGRW